MSSSCRQVSVTALVPDNLGQGDLVCFLVSGCILFPGEDVRMCTGGAFLISEPEHTLVSWSHSWLAQEVSVKFEFLLSSRSCCLHSRSLGIFLEPEVSCSHYGRFSLQCMNSLFNPVKWVCPVQYRRENHRSETWHAQILSRMPSPKLESRLLIVQCLSSSCSTSWDSEEMQILDL